MDMKGKTALVTGASSGLGVEFARQLAAMGANLVITARRADRLESLAAEIREKRGVKVTVLALDLSQPDAAQEIFDKTEAAGTPIDVLVNNAGFACFGPFVETPWECLRTLIEVDIRALTELAHLFSRAMVARDRGWILNVASLVAYMPIPSYAAYSAAKSYVRNFTEALAHELRDTKVRVCSLCPGGIATEFWEVAGQNNPNVLIRATMASPDRVARTGLRAVFGWRRNVVAGLLNALIAWLTRISPRRFLVRIAGLVVGRKS
ncbi:MAG: SDR family oxidoreductase [Deltaproteobacteria bacterium]|nr:SDR family oxidoreductase [Deltaproteobacteria bacterium]